MTGLFNLRTRLALFSALLILASLGSVYWLATGLARDLNTSGMQQDLGTVENRVLQAWSRERETMVGKLFEAVYDPANAAQLRNGGAEDLLLRLTLTMGFPRAWLTDANGQVVNLVGAGKTLVDSADARELARRAASVGRADGVVTDGNLASIVAGVRINEAGAGKVLFVSRPVDELLARTMTELSGAPLGFYKLSAGSGISMLGSLIDAGMQANINKSIAEVGVAALQSSRDLIVDEQTIRMSLLHQASDGNVYASILPPSRPVADKVQGFLYFVGVISAVALVLALVGGLVFGQRLTAALIDLTHAARQIGNGRYDVELPIRSSDELGRFVESFNVLAQSLKQREIKLFQSANRDTVTGLPTRAMFENQLVDMVNRARSRGESMSLVTVVVDRLREVNDSLGRKASDAMLSEIADRLRRQLKAFTREQDNSATPAFVARLATYEFGVVLPTCNGEQAGALASKIAEALARRVEFEGQSVLPGGEIGIAVYPDHGMDPGSLLYSADIAASHARAEISRIAVFDPSFESQREQQVKMLGELREALERGELHVALQPKVNLKGDGTLMAEALMRWEHPERGPQNPGEFVPFAEKTGFITQLTYWMIDSSLATAADWMNKGLPLAVSVNLSPRDLGSPDFTTYVVERLRAHKLRGATLTFEVTEQAVFNASPIVRQNLDVLHRLGVKIAIDDFGSGFATLDQLRSLPLSYLKIDRQYVRGLTRDKASRIIVQAAIALGHAIGVEVVAEGVEAQDQIDMLRRLKCDQVQGYFVGKPLGRNDFEAWVRNRSARFGVAGGSSLSKTGQTAATDDIIIAAPAEPAMDAEMIDGEDEAGGGGLRSTGLSLQ